MVVLFCSLGLTDWPCSVQRNSVQQRCAIPQRRWSGNSVVDISLLFCKRRKTILNGQKLNRGTQKVGVYFVCERLTGKKLYIGVLEKRYLFFCFCFLAFYYLLSAIFNCLWSEHSSIHADHSFIHLFSWLPPFDRFIIIYNYNPC